MNTLASRNTVAFVPALLCLLVAGIARGQSPGELKINVWDSTTHLPVTVASVFLAQTTIGEFGNDNNRGTYNLRNIPVGKYDLTIACQGYLLRRIPVELNGDQRSADVLLVPASEVAEPPVDPKSAEYRRLRKYFTREVLGISTNSKKCEIINMQDVEFRHPTKARTFVASNHKPLMILNEATGYRIFCWLDNAKIHYRPNTKGFEFFLEQLSEPTVHLGGLLFAEIPPKNNSQQKRWSKERKRAYNGSIPHFMVSLRSEKLKENNFEVKEEPGPNSQPQMSITYTAETMEQVLPGVMRLIGPQKSTIQFVKPGAVIYENGYYDHPENCHIFGYMNFTMYIPDLLPFDHR